VLDAEPNFAPDPDSLERASERPMSGGCFPIGAAGSIDARLDLMFGPSAALGVSGERSFGAKLTETRV